MRLPPKHPAGLDDPRQPPNPKAATHDILARMRQRALNFLPPSLADLLALHSAQRSRLIFEAENISLKHGRWVLREAAFLARVKANAPRRSFSDVMNDQRQPQVPSLPDAQIEYLNEQGKGALAPITLGGLAATGAAIIALVVVGGWVIALERVLPTPTGQPVDYAKYTVVGASLAAMCAIHFGMPLLRERWKAILGKIGVVAVGTYLLAEGIALATGAVLSAGTFSSGAEGVAAGKVALAVTSSAVGICIGMASLFAPAAILRMFDYSRQAIADGLRRLRCKTEGRDLRRELTTLAEEKEALRLSSLVLQDELQGLEGSVVQAVAGVYAEVLTKAEGWLFQAHLYGDAIELREAGVPAEIAACDQVALAEQLADLKATTHPAALMTMLRNALTAHHLL